MGARRLRLDRAAALLALGARAAIITIASTATTVSTLAAATFVTMLTLMLAAIFAAFLGRTGFIAGVTGLLARATVFTVETALAATTATAMAAAVVALTTVATVFITFASAYLGRSRFFREQALEPREETAGLLLRRSRGGSRAFITREIARPGVTLVTLFAIRRLLAGRVTVRGLIAPRFTRFEGAWFAAFRAERRTLIATGAGLVMLALGAFAPADGRTLHLLGGEDVELGLHGALLRFAGRNGGGQRRGLPLG